MFDYCFKGGANTKWKQSRTNLKWGLCAQVKKKIPHNSKTTSHPLRPLGGDSMREGQMWGLGLKAVHLPQIGVFVEEEEWRSSAKMARDTGSLSLCEVFSTLLDLKERKRKRKVSMLPSLPSTLRPPEQKNMGAKGPGDQCNTSDWLWQKTSWEIGELLSPKQDSLYTQGQSQWKTLNPDTHTNVRRL